MNTRPHVGRFAPTPSGYLHFGSLVTALAAYLDARSTGGQWLLRMEDLDPPREVPGAQVEIRHTLERYGFDWDGPVLRQSQRQAAYDQVIAELLERDLAYACICSRKDLQEHAGIYPGTCRERRLPELGAAIRLRVPDQLFGFVDRVQGELRQQLGRDVGDFVIRRRDGLCAYQLAVVLDDAWQGVTNVVRGADLLDSTPRQLYLQQLLGLPHLDYLHVPLIVQPDGHKLGKAYRSAALPAEYAAQPLMRALRALGQQPPDQLAEGSPRQLLDWGIAHWDAARIPRQRSLAAAQLR